MACSLRFPLALLLFATVLFVFGGRLNARGSYAHLGEGEVLVAENISPRWTPLLAVVHALVLDTGGLGQHAAITAREYGVPAVTGVPGATRWIRTGDLELAARLRRVRPTRKRSTSTATSRP